MHFLCGSKFLLTISTLICTQHVAKSEHELPISIKHFLPTNSLPDTAKNAFSYLEEHNYYYENHTVTTDDGYVLLTVRIPHGKKQSPRKNRIPVLFVHGLTCTFHDFLSAGTENAIGFKILEEGYDVWLINCRGSTYGKSHTSLDPVLNASAFWNFRWYFVDRNPCTGWHEIAYYDVPANMDYIEKVTGFSNMSLVGHSQGGTVYLALAASRPEYDRRITFSLQLAPTIAKVFGWNQIFPYIEIYKQIGNAICYIDSPFTELCSHMIKFIGGPSKQNGTLASVLSVDHPAGSSINQLLHYLQIAVSDNFQLYDYGAKGNMVKYNQEIPPLYNLSAITSPVAIYYGESDCLISVPDGERLASEVPNAFLFFLDRNTNHIDVQWKPRTLKNIFRTGIKLLNKYNGMS